MKPCFAHVFFSTLLAAVACNALAEDLYRWVDEQGKVQYGDVPSPEVLLPEHMKFMDSPLPDADLPYETRRAKEAFPVTLYVADYCKDPCQRARELLNSRGIPFTQKNLVTLEDIDAFHKLTNVDSVPVLAVGNNLFKKFQADEWNNGLDFAGYPKAAYYGFRPIGPPPPAPVPPAQPTPVPPPESGSEPSPQDHQ